MQSDEVEANHSAQLRPVEQYQELWLHSRIKIHLDVGREVAVDADVLELAELGDGGFVVLLDLGDHRVPLRCEVDQRERRLLVVHVLYQLVQVLGHL